MARGDPLFGDDGDADRFVTLADAFSTSAILASLIGVSSVAVVSTITAQLVRDLDPLFPPALVIYFNGGAIHGLANKGTVDRFIGSVGASKH